MPTTSLVNSSLPLRQLQKVVKNQKVKVTVMVMVVVTSMRLLKVTMEMMQLASALL